MKRSRPSGPRKRSAARGPRAQHADAAAVARAPVHEPILTQAVVDGLDLRPGSCCIDATINGGGHASAILERTAPNGRLLGLDRDASLLDRARERLAEPIAAGRLRLVHRSFGELRAVAHESGFTEVDGIVFDLGMSSHHIDAGGRGFSFARDEPLDMRFDVRDLSCRTAAELLRRCRAEDLARIFREYGEERFARRIATVVTERRQREPIETSAQLCEVITAALPARLRWRASRSAARVFQALRIAVNAELEAVEAALPQAVSLLVPGGRLAVLSFHSLEDRLVKQYFRRAHDDGFVRILTRKPLRPDEEEIERNPRSASARLRICERVT